MESTEGYKLAFTHHAQQQLDAKGVESVRAREAFENPEKIYPNKKYKGQFRVVGNGLCLVGQPMSDRTFRVFTVYEDGVMTPPRPDQLLTEEGRKYAALYEAAQKGKRVKRSNEYYPRVNKRRAASDIPHMQVR
jgi:hypothetical protein